MTECLTTNDVRRLLTAASALDTKYTNRMATLCEVAFTLSFFAAMVIAWLL